MDAQVLIAFRDASPWLQCAHLKLIWEAVPLAVDILDRGTLLKFVYLFDFFMIIYLSNADR